MKQPFLTGERIYLRGLLESDLDGHYVSWLNDAEVCQYNSHHQFPYSRQSAADYIKSMDGNRSALVLAICLIQGDLHIGNISLQAMNPVSRQAEFAILMGDKRHWGQGYSKEAAYLICKHGFEALNLNRIHCGTSEENVPMQRLAGFMGMKEEGRRRQAHYKNGQYVDLLEYGVLRCEFETKFSGEVEHDKPVEKPKTLATSKR